MPHQLFERASRQRADRIEGNVAQQLHPDLVTEARVDGTPKAGGNQRLGNRPQPLGLAAVGLAETDLVDLGMPDHTRFDDVRREVHQRSDDAPRLDGGGDDAAGIDAIETESVELAADSIEVPPGNPVLRADDDGVASEEGLQRWDKACKAVGLDAKEHDVGRPDGRQVARNGWMDLEIAVGTDDAKSALLHRLQVRTAREEHQVDAGRRGARQAGADVAADGACAGDDDLHS
jgi:hypothetical protein